MTCRFRVTAATIAVCFGVPAAIASEIEQAGTTISKPWARATPPGARVGAAYFVVRSRPGDVLLAAKADVAERVELHTHMMDAGIMRMRPVPNVPIAAGKTVVFEPGGYHVMLIELRRPLKIGETVPVTLVFQRAGTMTVEAEIKAVGARAP